MEIQGFFGFLVQIVLIAGLFVVGPFLLFFLTTTYSDHLATRGKYHRAYRFSHAVYYFTDIPLLRLWIGKFHYLQLRQLAELAEKIGDKSAAVEWLRLAAETRFTPSERIHALTQLAMLLRKQERTAEAEITEAEALAVIPDSAGPPSTGSKIKIGGPITDAASTKVAQAAILTNQGRFADALALLDEASNLDVSKRPFRFTTQRAIVLRYVGRHEEAIAEHNRYAEEWAELIGKILSRATSNNAMHVQIRESLRGHDTTTVLPIVESYLEAGQPGAASEQWSRLPVAMDNTTRALRHAVGAWLSALQGDADATEAQIAKAGSAPMRDDETRRVVAFTLARAEFVLQQYPRAAERLEELVQDTLHTPLPQAEYRALLAACYAKMGRFADARAQYEQVLTAGFEEAAFTQRAQTELSELPVTDA